MTDERELERHNRILEQIKNANTKEELPSVSFSSIASFLASNVYFEGVKISQSLFQPVVNEIVNYGNPFNLEVRNAFVKVVLDNYPNITIDDANEKFNTVMSSKRIGYILSEISQKNLKLDEMTKADNLNYHNDIIKQINSAYEVKDLPKVGLSELNKKLIRAVNDNDFITNIKISDIKDLTNAYLANYTYLEKEDVIKQIVSKYDLSEDEKTLMKEQIMGSLIMDETIDYTIEELNLKEKRKLFIYGNDHELTMDAIKDARRISQLPPNLTPATLNGYLNGNTTIYTNDDRIKSEDLKRLTSLLMDNHKWDEELVIDEVRRIANEKYPEKEDAFDLLYKKLSVLPKTYYYVEEIKYSQERQAEFIGRGSSNVNVYFIPNPKSPMDGGLFYNCYINRVDNLDLSKILPLDLNTIVPPEMDIDSVEWYVQEKFDPTFKTAGGIILNRDETIGNVSVFKPNDGTVGVSPEEKEKMDKINDLDSQIEEKQKKLEEINKELEEKENKATEVNQKMKQVLLDYEKKALALQMELLTNISSLKADAGIDDGGLNGGAPSGKELK
ncbi:MAG: hypothetical protein IKE73_01100 [Bacilli bacterium]|nr:hypothetical protein [Bacilli bacterium]